MKAGRFESLRRLSAAVFSEDYFSIDYVWGQWEGRNENTLRTGKVHILLTFSILDTQYYRTLCGLDDLCGCWDFANESCFDDDDGCKHCRQAAQIDIENNPHNLHVGSAVRTLSGASVGCAGIQGQAIPGVIMPLLYEESYSKQRVRIYLTNEAFRERYRCKSYMPLLEDLEPNA